MWSRVAGCGWELLWGCWMWTSQSGGQPPVVQASGFTRSESMEGTRVVGRDAGAQSPEEFAGQEP